MVKFEALMKLQKQACVSPGDCNLLAEGYSEERDLRRCIFEQDGRYYLRETIGNEVSACFEIAVDWRPFGKKTVFAFTPDDRHLYQVDDSNPLIYSVLNLKEHQILAGDRCSFEGMTVEYIDQNHLRLNNVVVPVVSDSEYVYSLQKTRIKAANAATGLYIFLENIAERWRAGDYPVLSGSWSRIFQKYNAA